MVLKGHNILAEKDLTNIADDGRIWSSNRIPT